MKVDWKNFWTRVIAWLTANLIWVVVTSLAGVLAVAFPSILFFRFTVSVWHLFLFAIVFIAFIYLINTYYYKGDTKIQSQLTSSIMSIHGIEWEYFYRPDEGLKTYEPICPDCGSVLDIKDVPPYDVPRCSITCTNCDFMSKIDAESHRLYDNAEREMKHQILTSYSNR